LDEFFKKYFTTPPTFVSWFLRDEQKVKNKMSGYILPLREYSIICIVLLLIEAFSGNEIIRWFASTSIWFVIIYFAIPTITTQWCNRKIRKILTRELMDNEIINCVPLLKILNDSFPKMIFDFKPPEISLYLNNKCPYCRGVHHKAYVKYVFGGKSSQDWTITCIDTLATSCLNKEKHSGDPWVEVFTFQAEELKKEIIRQRMKIEGRFN